MSCFERPDPPWLLDESVEILAVRGDVVEPGPFADEIAPVPADRWRAEALPGDRVRARLVAASLEGIAADADVDAAWFICRDDGCITELRDADTLVPCGGLLEPGDGCSLGHGAEVMFDVPELVPDSATTQVPASVTIGAVLGTPDGPTTGECVGRLTQRPYPSLAGCSMFQHLVPAGPGWKLAELIGADAEDVPIQARFVPPNFSPEIERFDVSIRAAEGDRDLVMAVGERTSVSPGDVVRLEVQIDPRDYQKYFAIYEDMAESSEETLVFRWFADVVVSTATESWTEPAIVWTVPDDVDQVSFVTTVTDLRGGVGWGNVAFDVGGVAP
jgi:hypothetical protein